MIAKLTWEKLIDGTWFCKEHPIKIPPRYSRADPLELRVPTERGRLNVVDAIDDGWYWQAVSDPAILRQAEFWSVADAKRWAEDNLDVVLRQATDEPYDGDYRAEAEWQARKTMEINAAYGGPPSPSPAQQSVPRALPRSILAREHRNMREALVIVSDAWSKFVDTDEVDVMVEAIGKVRTVLDLTERR